MTQIEKAVLPVSEAGTGTGAQALPVDLGTLLAAADPARGESVGKVCASCHTFEQGGPNRTGPNLWGIVGRPVASAPGFAYSDALAGHPGAWTYEQLEIGTASGRERVCPYVKMSVVAGALKKKRIKNK